MRKNIKRGLAVVLSSTLLLGSTVFCQAAGRIYKYESSAIGSAVIVAEGNIGLYTAKLQGSNAGIVTNAKFSVGKNGSYVNVVGITKLPAYSTKYTNKRFSAKGSNRMRLYKGANEVLSISDQS